MAGFKAYVSDYDYPDLAIEKSVLGTIGAEVIGLHCKTGHGLAELAADADVILQQYAKIPRETLAKLKRCKGICRYGIGLDIVDVKAAYEHGMVVTNVPDYCLDEVADHAIALAFMLIRRIPMYVRGAREGHWHWSVGGRLPSRYRDLTWGSIGFGRIAQNTTHKLKPFGFTVLAYDPIVSAGYMRACGVQKVSLDDLLSRADVVNVACPHTPETFHLINEATLRKMRPHAVLVNCARGKIVDNAALYKALEQGWIASAGLDDPEEEPAKLDTWSPQNNPLFGLENCIITPHVAYVSEGSLRECRRTAAENARAILLGETPPNLVRP
ncbi:MAG TPA: C-terminal binding protein [Candidatus Methylomirabilis sp.]|nr:C-terminal binding protein [Candidatus Methylomirabilis sp.]